MARAKSKKRVLVKRYQPEPNWRNFLAEKPTAEDIQEYFYESLRYYHNKYNPVSLRKDVEKYLKDNDYSKENIRYWKKADGWKTNSSMSVICKMLNDGMPDLIPNPWDSDYKAKSHHDWVQSRLNEIITLSKKEIDALQKEQDKEAENNSTVIKKKNIVNIQERMDEKLGAFLEKFDYEFDNFVKNTDKWTKGKSYVSDYSIFKHLQKENLPPKIASKIYKEYEDTFLDLKKYVELYGKKDLTDDNDIQLMESYSYLTKKQAMEFITFLENMHADVNMYVGTKKSIKPRKKRKMPVLKEKLIAKLKYKVNDQEYRVSSISPIKIIGADELWVFNTKTRKIGKYVAQNIDPKKLNREGTGLSVKGTTIQGFNPDLSVQKILRKPEEQLKEFDGLGKIKLRKFLPELKAKEIKLTGRINQDTLLLKVN